MVKAFDMTKGQFFFVADISVPSEGREFFFPTAKSAVA